MKVTFLGTGTSQGIPVIACDCKVCRSENAMDKRLRSSVLIEVDGNTFVIDAGPDFRYQMLREDVKKIDAILITHGHKDHTGGLDDVRAFNYFLRKPIDVYLGDNALQPVNREFCYAFDEKKYPGVPEINLHVIENNPFEINNIKIIPIEAMHYKLPVFGYRIGNFTYLTDINFISDEEKEKIKGSEVVVVNALRKRKHVSHFSLNEAVELLAEINPQKAYITHISHMMGLHDEVEKELPGFIRLAYDGLKIEVD